jgi:hypothetical protein
MHLNTPCKLPLHLSLSLYDAQLPRFSEHNFAAELKAAEPQNILIRKALNTSQLNASLGSSYSF